MTQQQQQEASPPGAEATAVVVTTVLVQKRRPIVTGPAKAFHISYSSNPLHAWKGAKLVLRNESDYRVSYWVVQEDKLTTKSIKRRVFRNIEDHLNDGGSAVVNAKVNTRHAWNMINAEHALDGEYFLLRDERFKGNYPGYTEVRFPKGSERLRIYCYAWFEREAEWRVFRDKVCKNGIWGKTFNISCRNGTIEPFELGPPRS